MDKMEKSYHGIGLQGFNVSSWSSHGRGLCRGLGRTKGGRLDAQDGRGCACALGRRSPHRRPADPS